MSGNALRAGGFTLPNPIVMMENMLGDGVIFQNENHQSDNFGKMKMGNPFQEWAFLGGDGRNLKKQEDHSSMGGGAGMTTPSSASTTTSVGGGPTVALTAAGRPTSVATAATATAGGPVQVAQRGVVQQRMSVAQYGKTPTQTPTQSPMQSPVQSPIQGPPQKGRPGVPVQVDPPIKKGISNPLAVPVGIADGLVDFLTHCVGAHVEFLWKDPAKLMRDPVGALKLNQLEVNPLGHIFKSIEKANQRDNPLQQLREIPMGLETLPFLKGKAQPGQVGQAPTQH